PGARPRIPLQLLLAVARPPVPAGAARGAAHRPVAARVGGAALAPARGRFLGAAPRAADRLRAALLRRAPGAGVQRVPALPAGGRLPAVLGRAVLLPRAVLAARDRAQRAVVRGLPGAVRAGPEPDLALGARAL